MLRIDYTLSPDDARASLQRLRRALLTEASRRRAVAVLRILTIVLGVAFGFAIAQALSAGGGRLVAMIVAGAVALYLADLASRVAVARSIDALVTGDVPLMAGARTLAFEADGITQRWNGGNAFFEWATVRSAETDAQGVWIALSRTALIHIPARALPHGEAERIVEFVRERIRQAPQPEPELARPYPAEFEPAAAARMPPAGADAGPAPSFAARLARNLAAGGRLATFRAVAPASLHATLGQAVALAAVVLSLKLLADVLHTGPDGVPYPWGLPGATFFVTLALLAAALYAALGRDTQRGPQVLVALLALAPAIQLAGLGLEHLAAALAPEQLASRIDEWREHVLVAWAALAGVVAAIRLVPIARVAQRGAALAVAAVVAVAGFVLEPFDSLWAPRPTEDAAARRARMALASEAAFYQQPRLLDRELGRIEAGRKGVVDLYFIGAAGYADQDVFMREVRTIAALFEQRFDTAGRSVSLINNPRAVMDAPIASVTALRRVLSGVGRAMDPDEDVLFLFLTSHGSQSHELSLDFWPLRFDRLGPAELKSALDESGIKWRVIVVSACYSGGFVPALADEHTIVITAAAPDRQSFGCSNEADFTYFGRAYFDQALRETRSFVTAFEQARELVARRERAEERTPSNPQMHAGAAIRSHLAALEARLEGGNAAIAAAPAATDALRMRYARVVTSLEPIRLLQEVRTACAEVSRAVGPEWSVKRAPESFGPIVPGTPQWPQLVAAYEDMTQASCDSPAPETWMSLQVDQWTHHLPARHLDGTLAFLESETGKAFAAAYRDASVASTRAASRLQMQTMQTASERYFVQMRGIYGAPASAPAGAPSGAPSGAPDSAPAGDPARRQ